MFSSALTFLSSALIAVPVIVTGKPQHSLTGISPAINIGLPPDPQEPFSGLSESSSSSELSGLVRLQFYIKRGNGNGYGNLIKVHESNATFHIPAGGSSRKCPGKELLFEPDGKCYPSGVPTFGIPTPCADDFMIFAELKEKPGYGACHCVQFKGSETLPVVYWNKSNRCYWLYHQGPCKSGEWLVFSTARDPDGELVCSRRSCPENKEDPSNSFQKYWFQHKGKCYQTGSPNQEFCRDNGKNLIYFSADRPEPVCLERRPIIMPVKGLVSGAGNLGCKAGQKQLPNGSCKRVASFD